MSIFLNDHRTYILCEVQLMFKQMFLNKLPVPDMETINYKLQFLNVHYKSISVNACSIRLKNQLSSDTVIFFSKFKLNCFKWDGNIIMLILKKFANIELCLYVLQLDLFIYIVAFVYYSEIVPLQIVCQITSRIVWVFFLNLSTRLY